MGSTADDFDFPEPPPPERPGILDIQYDPRADLVKIEGIMYAGQFFRQMRNGPIKVPFQIVERPGDGTLFIQEFLEVGRS